MYMLVFVTLIVALIGLYTQVFNVQMAHMYAQQSGVAKAMLDWHATAVGLAENAIAAASLTTSPTGACSLTQGWGSVSVPFCYKTGPVNVTLPSAGGLPPGYQSTPYIFYSTVYQGASQTYVLTFVPPPLNQGNGAPGFVCLPGMLPVAACAGNGQQQIDIVLNDLLIQLRRRGVSAYSYGTVATVAGVNYLVTPSVPGPNNNTPETLSYPIPAMTPAVPAGSVGVISQVNICSNC